MRHVSYLVISGHNSHEKFNKSEWNQVKLESIRTLLKIIRLASKKSYLVISGPNSHEKLTKILI